MTQQFIITVLLVCLSLCCNPSVYQDNITSGIISLVPTTPGQSIFSYTFTITFTQIPRVVVGICSFSSPQQVNNNDNSYYALPSATSHMLQVKSRSLSSNWAISRATFLATTNSQLLLETLSTEIVSASSQSNQQNLVFKLNSKNTLNPNQPFIIRTFLSGVSSVRPIPLIALRNCTLQNDQLSLIITIYKQAKVHVWIGLVVFSQQSSTFSTYGGTVLINKLGSTGFDVLQTFSAVQSNFYGINALMIDVNQKSMVDIHMDNNFMLASSLQGASSMYQLHYIFFGQLPQDMCKVCASQSRENIYYNGQCVSYCPFGTTLVTLSNQGLLCRLNLQGSLLTNQGGQNGVRGSTQSNGQTSQISENGGAVLVTQNTNTQTIAGVNNQRAGTGSNINQAQSNQSSSGNNGQTQSSNVIQVAQIINPGQQNQGSQGQQSQGSQGQTQFNQNGQVQGQQIQGSQGQQSQGSQGQTQFNQNGQVQGQQIQGSQGQQSQGSQGQTQFNQNGQVQGQQIQGSQGQQSQGSQGQTQFNQNGQVQGQQIQGSQGQQSQGSQGQTQFNQNGQVQGQQIQGSQGQQSQGSQGQTQFNQNGQVQGQQIQGSQGQQSQGSQGQTQFNQNGQVQGQQIQGSQGQQSQGSQGQTQFNQNGQVQGQQIQGSQGQQSQGSQGQTQFNQNGQVQGQQIQGSQGQQSQGSQGQTQFNQNGQVQGQQIQGSQGQQSQGSQGQTQFNQNGQVQGQQIQGSQGQQSQGSQGQTQFNQNGQVQGQQIQGSQGQQSQGSQGQTQFNQNGQVQGQQIQGSQGQQSQGSQGQTQFNQNGQVQGQQIQGSQGQQSQGSQGQTQFNQNGQVQGQQIQGSQGQQSQGSQGQTQFNQNGQVQGQQIQGSQGQQSQGSQGQTQFNQNGQVQGQQIQGSQGQQSQGSQGQTQFNQNGQVQGQQIQGSQGQQSQRSQGQTQFNQNGQVQGQQIQGSQGQQSQGSQGQTQFNQNGQVQGQQIQGSQGQQSQGSQGQTQFNQNGQVQGQQIQGSQGQQSQRSQGQTQFNQNGQVQGQQIQGSQGQQSQGSQGFSSSVSSSPIVGIVSNPSSNINLNPSIISSRCPFAHMFWNGAQCLCFVGYSMINNLCIQTVIINIPSNNTNGGSILCTGQNQVYNGTTCVCRQGYFMVSNVCTQCPTNSQWNGQYCQCVTGFSLSNGVCTTGQSVTCPPNSTNNGLGTCLCSQPNHRIINNICQLVNCPLNQQWNGTVCICDLQRFTLSNGLCSPHCQNGSQWNQQSKTCTVVCKVNESFDKISQKCSCIPGLGVGKGNACQSCQNSYKNINGYCATCPAFSSFSTQNKCQCKQGYASDRSGQCTPKCQQFQFYDTVTTRCECLKGLGKINGICTPCPRTTNLVNGICSNCPPNADFSNGKCICKPGFIENSKSLCVSCNSLPNSFLINNLCAQCPSQQLYNPTLKKCQCPQGTKLQGGRCVQSCKADELIDNNGQCYSCPINMYVVNGGCSCSRGYVRGPAGCGCVLSCRPNQFTYRGMCAQCPLSMEYSSVVNGCICPNGFYLSSANRVCMKSLTTPQTGCSLGQFYSVTGKICRPCPQNCYNCTASSCIQCNTGFQFDAQSVCSSSCGDGIIIGIQQCDTGAFPQLGCNKCVVVTGYTCNGQPSICNPDNITPQPPIPPLPSTDSLSQVGTSSVNTNNIFITLKTTPTFTFTNEEARKNFIQAKYPNGPQPVMYCSQRNSPQLDIFDCLLIYPSGVPNVRFTVQFFYQYQGRNASVKVTVDPFSTLNTRNSRTNFKRGPI